MSFLPRQLHGLENRAVIKNFWLNYKSPEEAFESIATAYPDNHPTELTVQNWMDRFDSGRISILDDDRDGRPEIPGLTEQIKQFLVDDPNMSAWQMSEILDHSENTILDRLHNALGLKYLYRKWVPHILIQANKDIRVQKAKEIIQFLEFAQKQFFEFILTGDESWIYHRNAPRACWKEQGSPRQIQEKCTVASQKTMHLHTQCQENNFDSREDVIQYVQECCAQQSEEKLSRVMRNWMKRCNDVIEGRGEYVL
ncbi:MAG: hypothetical protein EZS28_027965 [Streblomastix strix]|uniref:Mos1 transposase HTH domain-containing protein n=1 Tax=Streblomastix strix TaxID=222440 RepID=A0A5J4V283_9EUKA|nr:MAG: hypothetical protein EZS28_027965 [Streblomastix strix]